MENIQTNQTNQKKHNVIYGRYLIKYFASLSAAVRYAVDNADDDCDINDALLSLDIATTANRDDYYTVSLTNDNDPNRTHWIDTKVLPENYHLLSDRELADLLHLENYDNAWGEYIDIIS